MNLWLVIPAFRRYDVTAIAFPQLAWTLNLLTHGYDIEAHAVVIADDENADIARQWGFDVLDRPNQPLGRKWNDGYEYACTIGEADYVVPCGTDDWIDPDYLAMLPEPGQVRCPRRSTTVREDGQQLAHITVGYEGGDGIRILPASLLESSRYRPADDDRDRAIDTSVWRTLKAHHRGVEFVYSDDPLHVVQFQSHSPQLNTYRALTSGFAHTVSDDPWGVLRSRFPGVFVDAAEAMYEGRRDA